MGKKKAKVKAEPLPPPKVNSKMKVAELRKELRKREWDPRVAARILQATDGAERGEDELLVPRVRFIEKPHLFLSALAFSDHPGRDGFLLDSDGLGLRWRTQGEVYHYRRLDETGARLTFATGQVELQADQPVATEGHGDLDLRLATTMRLFLDAFLAAGPALWLPPQELS